MSKPHPLTTWCRLLRLPNLFTVPGDPLAGFMLATGGVLDWRVAGAMATSLILYSAGLLLNDYFDREIDARERHDRPIPSGAVKAGSVLTAGLVLLALGVGVAFAASNVSGGTVAMTLAIAVLAYDGWLKRVRRLGPVVMGSCRAGSVVLGAAFVCRPLAPPVAVAAAIAWVYTTAVSVIAAGETGGAPVGKRAFTPAAVLVVGGCAMGPYLARSGILRFFGIALLLIAAGQAAWAALAVCRGKSAVPPFIGALIREMITVQAAWCLWLPTLEAQPTAILAGAGLAIGKLCADIAARRFYGS